MPRSGEVEAPAGPAAPAAPPPETARPPVILLGGTANAMSLARSYGRRGIDVYALNRPDAHVCRSRFCRRLSTAPGAEGWTEFLLGEESERLRGAVLFPCADAAIDLMLEHRDALKEKFRLDVCDPESQRAMLNKLATYEIAAGAGVPTPRFWSARSVGEIEAIRGELVYPLLLKPHYQHHFVGLFGRKFLKANDFDEVVEAFRRTEEHGIDVVLLEMIPGPDDHVTSHYGYVDDSGEVLYSFTKGVLRRDPPCEGGATYHLGFHCPRTEELALKFYAAAGVRGIACPEFKKDPRDGEFKLIECNNRFTAAIQLVIDSGLDLASFVYDRIVGLPHEPPGRVLTEGKRLWFPVEDFKSFLKLRRRGELTLLGWLKSIAHVQRLPYWSWTDPWPTLRTECGRLGNLLASPFRKPPH